MNCLSVIIHHTLAIAKNDFIPPSICHLIPLPQGSSSRFQSAGNSYNSLGAKEVLRKQNLADESVVFMHRVICSEFGELIGQRKAGF
jgi:hypothetical protein